MVMQMEVVLPNGDIIETSPAPKHGPQNAVRIVAPVSKRVANVPFFTSSI